MTSALAQCLHTRGFRLTSPGEGQPAIRECSDCGASGEDVAGAWREPVGLARVTHGLPFEEYCKRPGVHFSDLKYVAISPLHYRCACGAPDNDTPAKRLGRTVHRFILEPDTDFTPKVERVVFDGPVRRGKAWEAFKAAHPGAVIVKQSELDAEEEERDRAEAMRDAVWAHPQASELLSDGHAEVTIEWTHRTGLLVRTRLDFLGAGGVVDLKSTRSIDPRLFPLEVARRLYHAQLGLYCEGAERLLMKPQDGLIIAVENVPPFDVDVYRVDPHDLAQAWRTVEGWIETVAKCTASGHWPGVGASGVRDLKLPDWAHMSGVELDLSGIEGAIDGD